MGGVEKKKEAAVHLIDNRCKSLAKGVKGHCCHDNNVWVNANGGQGVGQGLEAWGSGRVQGSLLQFFLDKGATSPFPPLSSWWMLMLARLRRDATIEFDITHQNDRPPQSDADPSAAAPFKHQTSSVAPMMAGGGGFWGGTGQAPHAHHPSVLRPCTRGLFFEVVPGDPLLVFAPKVHCQWMGCITLTHWCNRNFFWRGKLTNWGKLFTKARNDGAKLGSAAKD